MQKELLLIFHDFTIVKSYRMYRQIPAIRRRFEREVDKLF